LSARRFEVPGEVGVAPCSDFLGRGAWVRRAGPCGGHSLSCWSPPAGISWGVRGLMPRPAHRRGSTRGFTRTGFGTLTPPNSPATGRRWTWSKRDSGSRRRRPRAA